MTGLTILEGFWAGMAAHLWQSSAVLVVLFILAYWLREARPGVRHTIWALALAKLLLPLPLLGRLVARVLPDSLLALLPRPAAATTAADAVDVMLAPASALAPPAGLSSRHLLAALTVVWAAGVAIVLARWIRDAAREARRHGTPARDAASTGLRRRIARALRDSGLSADHVEICEDRFMPAARGILRPRILLPRAAAELLDDEELRAVLLHEAAHCRRRDPLLAHMQRLAQASFFFHPFLWPVLRGLGETAELACDEAALRAGVSPRALRSALGRTLRLGLDPAPAPSALAAHRPSLLRRRLERLAAPGRFPVMTRHRIALALAAVLVASVSFFPLVAHEPAPAPPAPAAEPETPLAPAPSSPPAVATPASEAAPPSPAPAPGVEPVPAVAPAAAPVPAPGSHGPAPAAAPPAPAAVSDDDVLLAGQDTSTPKIIHRVPPEYPEDARKEGIEGRVILQTVIDEEGRTQDIEVLRGVEEAPSLDEAAVDAVRQWVYEPALKDDKPVSVYLTVVIQFKLDNDGEKDEEEDEEEDEDGEAV